MKTKWNHIAIGVIIGLGLACGFQYARCLRFPHHKDNHSRHERLLKKFSSRLDLTADQRTQVDKILSNKRSRVSALFDEMKPRFETIRKETSDDIKKILHPDQQQKYEALDAEMEARFKGRFSSH